MLIFTYINCHYNPVGNKMRRHSNIDHLITYFDTCLRFFPTIHQTNELAIPPNIIRDNNDNDLSYSEKNSSISMLRVNHCGEVCAQALYQAQAIFAKDASIQQNLQNAAIEEVNHLTWCKTRLAELNGKTSYLSPLFGLGSFFIGSIFGLASDKWSLSFLAETEYQVAKHLDSQLQNLPERDHKTQAILKQMRIDELNHAITAESNGAVALPRSIKFLMQSCAKIMTTTTKYI